MDSPFFPDSFDAQAPVAVIAGRGDYPLHTVASLRSHQVPLRLIAFEGETRPELTETFQPSERALIKVGQVGRMLKALEKMGARYAIMAGQITPRRLFKGLHPDVKAVAMLARLKERNAESIFGAIAAEIEKLGVHLLDARAGLEDHLASQGFMHRAKHVPDNEALHQATSLVKELARLNIGQGAVFSRGTVLAVEAYEGTDAMLRRAGAFDAPDTLFVKTVKPAQDYRFDVPVFGLRTIAVMAEAGISSAALEAGNTIMLDKEAVIDEACRQNITLLGYPPHDAPPRPEKG